MVKKQDTKSISYVVMEALLTHPEENFIVSDIHAEVERVLDRKIAKSTIGNYVTYQFVKSGIIKRISDKGKIGKESVWSFTDDGRKLLEDRKNKVKRINYRRAPAGRPRSSGERTEASGTNASEDIDALAIGEAIIENIFAMRKELNDLKNRLADSALRHNEDVKAFKQTIREKDNTIREANFEIQRLKKAQQVRGRTMKLEDVAKFTSFGNK